MSAKVLGLAALVALGGALLGCTPGFDHLEIKPLTVPPLPVTLTTENITLPVGVAVGVQVTAINSQGDEMDSSVEVLLTSKSTSIVGSDPGIDARTFVLYGVAPGTTSLDVRVDHLDRSEIPVAVMLQPKP